MKNQSDKYMLPEELRLACRKGKFASQTSGHAPGFAQANICILPMEYAFDFLLFCQRNPKPCPLLHVVEAGSHIIPQDSSNDVDMRTDVPKYRIYRDGTLIEEVTDISSYWRNDFVTFVIGCSFSFEDALINAGLSIRHQDDSNKTVPMYQTNIECVPSGRFQGNLVVSMRPFTPQDAIRAVEITSRYPRVHGAPIHIGDPSAIGISNIDEPDYGDSVSIREGEVPVFWACGVTPQAAVQRSKPSICITHSPGHMLILDQRNEALSN